MCSKHCTGINWIPPQSIVITRWGYWGRKVRWLPQDHMVKPMAEPGLELRTSYLPTLWPLPQSQQFLLPTFSICLRYLYGPHYHSVGTSKSSFHLSLQHAYGAENHYSHTTAGKLRHRETKWSAQGHSGSLWWSIKLNPAVPSPRLAL